MFISNMSYDLTRCLVSYETIGPTEHEWFYGTIVLSMINIVDAFSGVGRNKAQAIPTMPSIVLCANKFGSMRVQCSSNSVHKSFVFSRDTPLTT